MTFARDLANFADVSANNLTFRNLIINGAMQVAQRGTSTASITTSGYYTADRFAISLSSLGTWTQSIENDAPTGSGFRKSTKMLCTTADASPAAGDVLIFYQALEGQNLQSILKGTSSAKQLTLSFWIKSNVTGTYIAELEDNDNSRSVSLSYTVNTSATWEKKTITFPADVTGVFDNDNNASLALVFWLGAGTNWTSGSSQTSWGSKVNANRAAGQTANVASATNNYWQVTGVQLEVGSSASAFEFKPIDVELTQCQRYYEKSFVLSQAPVNGIYTVTYLGLIAYSDLWTLSFPNISFKIEKRGTPTMAFYGSSTNTWQIYNSDETYTTWSNIYTGGIRGFTPIYSKSFGVGAYPGGSSGLPVGTVRIMRGDWTADAEL